MCSGMVRVPGEVTLKPVFQNLNPKPKTLTLIGSTGEAWARAENVIATRTWRTSSVWARLLIPTDPLLFAGYLAPPSDVYCRTCRIQWGFSKLGSLSGCSIARVTALILKP